MIGHRESLEEEKSLIDDQAVIDVINHYSVFFTKQHIADERRLDNINSTIIY